MFWPKFLEAKPYFPTFAGVKYTLMQRILLLVIYCLPALCALAQELTLQGRVVDAETGEPLPYVNIRAGEGKATLTNIEGDFKFQIEPEDLVTFSFVGYRKMIQRAREVTDVVWLKPYSVQMQEVTVLPMGEEDLLNRIIENLKEDYKKGSKWTRNYFFRALMEEDSVSYIAEAFMDAFSVVNIRSAEIISGLQGYDRESGKKPMYIHGSNIHKLIEVGPKTYGSSFWKPVVKPLAHIETLKDFYKVRIQNLHDEEGQALFRFDFTWSKDLLPMDYNRRHITGTAYVDAETLRVLRFDGSIVNCTVRMGIMSYPVTIDFHLEYDYTNDAASVSNIAIQGGNAFMSYRVLLFAIEEDKQDVVKTKASGSNIVTALKEAGYDGSLWSKYDIIKRTKEEERTAFGQ